MLGSGKTSSAWPKSISSSSIAPVTRPVRRHRSTSCTRRRRGLRSRPKRRDQEPALEPSRAGRGKPRGCVRGSIRAAFTGSVVFAHDELRVPVWNRIRPPAATSSSSQHMLDASTSRILRGMIDAPDGLVRITWRRPTTTGRSRSTWTRCRCSGRSHSPERAPSYRPWAELLARTFTHPINCISRR